MEDLNITKYIFLLIAAGVGGFLYKKIKKTYRLNDSDVQYLTCLRLEEVLNWVERKLQVKTPCTLRILPNDATLQAFSSRLKLNEKDLKKCIYIVIIENESNNVVVRKLVIPQSLSEELSVLSNGTMYTLPIE